MVGELGGGEDGHHAVVVAGGDGVEFVVVALGALEWVGEEGLADGVDDVIEPELAGLLEDGHGGLLPRSHAEEAGGDEGVGVSGGEFVAGKLLEDEGGEGFILVEAADDVVAVAPGVGAGVVVCEAGGIGVADDIEPVAAEVLAVVRGGHKLVGKRGDGGLLVGFELRFKLGGLLWGWGESGEAKVEAAGELVGGGGWGRSEVDLGELGIDEVIDGIFSGGDFGLLEGAVGPEFFGFVASVLPGFVESFGGGDLFALGILLLDFGDAIFIRPGGSGGDPIADGPAFFLGELVGFLGWHFVVFDGAGGEEVEVAFSALSEGEDFVGIFVTAEEDGFAGAHVEATFDFFAFGTVAGHAFFSEEGLDVEGEEFFAIGGLGGLGGRKGGDPEEPDEGESQFFDHWFRFILKCLG